jgi:invasion protein IalB
MMYRNARAPALVSRTLGGLAKAAALSVVLAIAPATMSLAQVKKPVKRAPPPPAAQQPQAPTGQQPQQQPVQLIYSPWTKFCLQDKQPQAKKVCFTGKDARIESGMPVASAVLIEPDGSPKKIFRVTVPLGMALVNGTRVIIDQNAPMTAPFVFCVPTGCMADYEASADMVNTMKKGKGLFIQAIKVDGQAITIPLPLADFAKAYEGPPTDPKAFKEQQDKLQQELQRRAEEARRKLEAQHPTQPSGKTQ